MGFLAGKKALIVGLATDRSIAYGISRAMRREGAELAFTYQNDRIKERVVEIAGELGSTLVMPMDVGIDAEIAAAFARVKDAWSSIDIIVHSVAFAPREALTGTFVEATTRENFGVAHDVSSYSLTALARARPPLMEGRAGAILTSPTGRRASILLQRHGLAKASLEGTCASSPRISARNIRVNAISAGPIKTLAAAGIPGFRKMLHHVEQVSPLKRNVTIEDVGNAAAFLCSDRAAGITGETLYVDAGYSHVGMSFPE
jgi:enoyl-[acyl-carrier protein] reductase I